MPENANASAEKPKKTEEVVVTGKPVAEKKPDLVQAIVAPRRTITDGSQTFAPGAIVEMPEAEVARLRRTGHLLPPDGAVHPAIDGPTVNNEPV